MHEPQDRDRPAEPQSDALDAAKKQMADVGASIAETAANLRQAIEAGSVPPKAAAGLAERLEDLATRMAVSPVTEPTEPEGESR
jgi:hypothetical protein